MWKIFKDKKPEWFNEFVGITAALFCIGLTTLWFTFFPSENKYSKVGITAPEPNYSLFTNQYPSNSKFKKELGEMRIRKDLTPQNEILIHRSIALTSQRMDIPAALLWCLFFQESRLNHLLGIGKDKTAYGLGQFGYFSFYEINRQTNRFNKENLAHLTTLLGQDVRPISPRKSDLYHPSSYYYIPTAVVASSIYLSNRYHHLKGILEKQGLNYDQDILWVWAAMAYNKGTRSVLNVWNEVRRNLGATFLERVLQHRDGISLLLKEPKLIRRSLNYIWPTERAKYFSKELLIHTANITACSLNPKPKRAPEVMSKADVEAL